MNYLAHFHLAAAHDDWLVGALLGDFVKGPLRGEWPDGWERGIRLHRLIDGHSDRQPWRQQLTRELPGEFRRYGGILLDVYADHWLSRHWQTYAETPLTEFNQRVYGLLGRHRTVLPAAARHFSERLIEHDLLGSYGEWKMVPAVLARVSTRLRRANPLAEAGPMLAERRPALDECCALSYHDLLLVAARFEEG